MNRFLKAMTDIQILFAKGEPAGRGERPAFHGQRDLANGGYRAFNRKG
jgi:hypothetical protein